MSRHSATDEQSPTRKGRVPDSSRRVRWSVRMPQPLQAVTLVPGE